MNYLSVTRLYAHSNKNKGTYFIRRMYSYSCYSSCKAPNYLFSPFWASLLVGAMFSIIIKNHISDNLLYVKHQNEEIIARLKNLENREPPK